MEFKTSGDSRDFQAILEILWGELSEVDKNNYYDLKRIFFARYDPENDGDEKYNLRVATMFASSAYSDDCKSYFAADHVGSELILLLGDKFLTEEIVLGYLNNQAEGWIRRDYVNSLMVSSHLSERIIITAFKCVAYPDESKHILDLTPNSLITPEVINTWIERVSFGGPYNLQFSENRRFAANQIRRAHPEYDDFPDDWVLKIFCGE